jgi:hypothetical protein
MTPMNDERLVELRKALERLEPYVRLFPHEPECSTHDVHCSVCDISVDSHPPFIEVINGELIRHDICAGFSWVPEPCDCGHDESVKIVEAALAATPQLPEATHIYRSTAYHHGLHARCRKSCKFCSVPCNCPCHKGAQLPEAPEWEYAAANGPRHSLECNTIEEAQVLVNAVNAQWPDTWREIHRRRKATPAGPWQRFE